MFMLIVYLSFLYPLYLLQINGISLAANTAKTVSGFAAIYIPETSGVINGEKLACKWNSIP